MRVAVMTSALRKFSGGILSNPQLAKVTFAVLPFDVAVARAVGELLHLARSTSDQQGQLTNALRHRRT